MEADEKLSKIQQKIEQKGFVQFETINAGTEKTSEDSFVCLSAACTVYFVSCGQLHLVFAQPDTASQ